MASKKPAPSKPSKDMPMKGKTPMKGPMPMKGKMPMKPGKH